MLPRPVVGTDVELLYGEFKAMLDIRHPNNKVRERNFVLSSHPK
jgi:hypothetical protein